MKRWTIGALLLILATAACSPTPRVTPPSVAPSAPPAVATATQAPTLAGLTLDQLKNTAYKLLDSSSPRSVTLVNGAFTSPDPAATDYADIHLLDKVALADLNGDGQPDAAVLLAENYGGSGVFVSLIAMLNKNGQPQQGASAFIDDRPQINSLAAANGVITLDVLVHGPNDAMCCPTQHKVLTYAVTKEGLTAQTVTSFTPDGKERSIKIDSPSEGAEVSGEMKLRGSFTISPFENTLAYKVYDASGTELLSGPIMVTAPDLGGPGTFDSSIDISSIAANTPVRIAVQDVSAADGSILAMDSANVVVK
jgi:hypothetical protein